MNMSWKDVRVIEDPAEHAKKYVFSKDDAVAEAVLYRYPDYKTRTVICCSTQSGCPVGCRFCGAGDSFVKSLSPYDIIYQPLRLLEDVYQETGVVADDMGRLQIMFMSMGEPLLNMKGLRPAINALYEMYPSAALLISTIGPRINYYDVREMSVQVPTVGLQFSVHETTDEARDRLIPFKKKLSLREISNEGRAWFLDTGRKPFFNYCAHDGNSSEEDADRLLALFDPTTFCATVSVICERSEGLPATNDHQKSLATDFASKLVERGFDVRVFDPAGQDTIGGGCGQLWFVQQWMKEHPDLAKPSVGRGKPEVHTPIDIALSA